MLTFLHGMDGIKRSVSSTSTDKIPSFKIPDLKSFIISLLTNDCRNNSYPRI